MSDKKRILVVEDDRVVKSSLERLLQGEDCCIDSAASAREGLDKFQRQPYDFVLTDLKLPDLDGLEMIRKMRQMEASLPFIILSAYAQKEDAVRALKLGAVDFIQKPFNARQILDTLQKSLSQNCDHHTPTAASPHPDNTNSDPSGRGAKSLMKNPTQPDSTEAENRISEELLQLQTLIAPFVSIGRLTSGLTHNINGFLTGLIGHLELMMIKHPQLGAELDNVLLLAKKIRDNVGDLATKFDNETSREPQPQNLNQILQAELSFLRADLFFKHYIETQLDLQEPLPNVYGVYADFSLAFEEILLNAVDAQRAQKKGFIRLRTRVSGSRIIVEFEDGGPGFSAAALEHAQDPLWPEVKVLEDCQIRRGLGLFLARRWLTPWGGTIAIANLPRQGAQVTVTLPKREKVPRHQG